MTTHAAITPELRAWIVAQAQAGFTPEDVLAAMRGSGWPEDVAIEAMESTLSDHLQAQGRAIAGRPLPEPSLQGAPGTVVVDGHPVKVLLSMKLPRVVVFGGFLSDAECDELRALAEPRLARSETVVNETGGSEVNTARTSDGMFFGRGEFPVCERIERRIATLLNWPVSHGEGLQVLRYRPGAEYKPHHDYFDPAHPGTPTILSRGGQRVGTLVMYLNDPVRGGSTTFPDVGLEVAPVKGNAVFFSYHAPHPSTQTLHGGAPVREGEKWVATKWLREREFR
ncbi:2OG-Fe(II) oxygenase [Ideonella sp.]|uniref:2OG-Fe(II) oxygenase n=1 Tax=Ideonella sp. TaxID=1929293 RepID=UPI0035B29C37